MFDIVRVMEPHRTKDDVIQGMDALHARVSCSQRSMFELVAEADRQEAWQESGARDMAHFLSMRYGISCWKASRWIHAAHALEHLPRLSEALGSAQLGIDKVVELTRFATAETESDGWAVSRAGDGTVGWFHPDGTFYRRPAPPAEAFEPEPALAAVS